MTAPDLFFGYGSLVNRASHDFRAHGPAVLTGWRRMWRRSPLRPAAFLSVEPCPGVSIHGLLAEVPDGDWRALDTREGAYQRIEASAAIVPASGPVALYVMGRETSEAPSDAHPVLLSYLDVVMTGFLDLMGAAGPAHFAETTVGWDSGPIKDDRAAPIYARGGAATEAGRAASDAILARLGVAVLT